MEQTESLQDRKTKAEIEKMDAETEKLKEEVTKLRLEAEREALLRAKTIYENMKLERETTWFPVGPIAAIMGATAALLTAVFTAGIAVSHYIFR